MQMGLFIVELEVLGSLSLEAEAGSGICIVTAVIAISVSCSITWKMPTRPAGDEVRREGGAVDAHALVEHHLLGRLVVGDDVVDVEEVAVDAHSFAFHLGWGKDS